MVVYPRPKPYVSSFGYAITYNDEVDGRLFKTERKVKPVGFGVRRVYSDGVGQLWVKLSGVWWRFPQEVEY